MKPRHMKLVRALVMSFLVSTLLPCLSGWLSTCPRAHAYWDIPIKPVPFVCFDLYTQKGGIGPGISGGEYEPGESVILYVSMTSDGLPVQNTTIAFSIEGPTNCYFPTAVTNSSGIASATFKIPPLDAAKDKALGTWSVTAQTGLDMDTFGDSLNFEVVPIMDAPEFPAPTVALLAFILTASIAIVLKRRAC